MIRTYPQVDPLDWPTVQPHIDALLAAELTPHNVRAWLQQWSDLLSVIDETGAAIYRAVSEDTTDQEADARFRVLVTEVYPAYARAEQALKEKWLALDGYEPAHEVAQMYRLLKTEAELFREENVPIHSELSLLGKQYTEIVGGLNIQWEGEEKTIPATEVLLSTPDRSTRERAWRLALDAFLARREDLNGLFLQMLALRRKLAGNAGLDNYRSYQWRSKGRFDYAPEDSFTFHDAIEHEVTPLATELYRSLASGLGLDSLRPWETGISSPWLVTVDPHDSPLAPFVEVNELEATCQRIFDQVDPVFGDYFRSMRDGYLDLASRPNKAPGGYCNSFPVSGQPYIFMNGAGTQRNVATLLHEGGHAFHFAESYRQQSLIWNYGGPMEFNEVASMSMELLSLPYWPKAQGGFYEEEDYRRAVFEQLTGIVFFLPYMAVMDSVQHWLYVDAPADVSTSAIDRKWSELWDRFLPGIDYSGLQAQKETGWHRKGHIFSVPFYYIEYGLAQLGALQVWRNALQDQAQAVQAYRRALAAGYTRSLPELFALAGARFAFDRQMVGELMGFVREQLDRL